MTQINCQYWPNYQTGPHKFFWPKACQHFQNVDGTNLMFGSCFEDRRVFWVCPNSVCIFHILKSVAPFARDLKEWIQVVADLLKRSQRHS